MTRVFAVAVLASTILVSGCQLERFFPEQVGVNLARLTVRNVGQVTQLISSDTNCGFESPAVMADVTIDGEIGDVGTGTWTVYQCEISHPAKTVISTNCDGDDTSVEGKVVVTAVKTVQGIISGNPENPIIPITPDAATLEILAEFENHSVLDSSSEASLKVFSGSAYYFAEPHLAVSQSNGVCSVATSDITIRDVIWQNALVEIDSGTSRFDVEVPRSNFTAQVGEWDGEENTLEGTITVWDTKVDVPGDDVFQGLDPDYKRADFERGFMCKDDLASPLSYECPDLTPRFAQGIAQLSILTFGKLTSIVEENADCGFSAPAIMDNPTLTGELGYSGGQARYEISEPCRIEFTETTKVDEDCLGVEAFATGVIEVTGSKVVKGFRSGDPETPIVPATWDPASINLNITFHGFAITESDHSNQFFFESGSISGTTIPRTAIDQETGACSIATPIAKLDNVSIVNATGLLYSDGNQFRLTDVNSNVQAINGPRDGLENQLMGEVTIDGTSLPIPVEGEPNLDPDYSREKFDAEYACTANMKIPATEAECNFAQVLGEGTARLLIQTIGTIAGAVNSNEQCGFEAYLVKMLPDEVIGEEGEMGSMTWSIDDCSIGSNETVIDSEDCDGGITYTGGFTSIDATRTVVGEREKLLFLFDSIIPKAHQSVELALDNVVLDNLVGYSIAAGASEPLGILTLHSGTLSAVVEPILGERVSEPGSFEVTTPVALFSGVRLQNATATLESEGKIFSLEISDSSISAVNGSWDNLTNHLTGTINVNGTQVTLDNMDLNPDFNQTAFDSTYVCTEDLMNVVGGSQ
jgi:hypothetical protein